MKKTMESHLIMALERIETSIEKIMSTRGYCKDAARLRMLKELIKEQVTHEDTSGSTRTVR